MADEEEKNDEIQGEPVPKAIEEKLKRGREEQGKDAPLRRLCVKMWRGDQNWYLNAKGGLSFLPNALVDVRKQPHRIRNQYRFIHSIVEAKVSAATQRVPGYEITPSTGDPQDIAAARLAGQFAPYIYDKSRVRRASTKLITNAIVQREGFARAYFDPNVGPFVEMPKNGEDGLPELTEDGELVMEQVGMGEIKVMVYNRSEVGWEPATDFEESRWHYIDRAMVKDDVYNLPGYLGGTLRADAETRDIPDERKSDNKVIVTEYLERPCPDYPKGRRCFIANKRLICKPDDYPVVDPDGQVLDEPALHRLSYTVDPEGDDRGLVEHLIDLARTIDDCYCKLLEIKNRALIPQMSAPKGANVTRRDDTPGATWYYNVVGGQKPEWERPIDAGYINQVLAILELAKADMRAIAADLDVQAEPDLAAKTVSAAVEQARLRWQSFLGDLAEVHSRLMRDMLTLAALHYSEKKQVEIRGQYGWEPLQDFTGQDLRSQVNVRVLPGSLETKSRPALMQELQFIQANWPGALSPEAAMAAVHGGSAEGLLRSYELDVAAANETVRMIHRDGEQVLLMPNRFDSSLGMEVPGWMPRKQYNLAIFKQVLGDYIKTPAFSQERPEVQHIYDLVWDGLEWLEQARAMKIQAQTMATAADQGMGNAAAPQPPAALPQPQEMTREQADPAAMTPA